MAQNSPGGAKRRFWSMCPFTRATHFWNSVFFEPQPFVCSAGERRGTNTSGLTRELALGARVPRVRSSRLAGGCLYRAREAGKIWGKGLARARWSLS